MVLFLLLSIWVLIIRSQRPPADKITDLPGLNFKTTYDQYSGYLDLTNGHHLHYWLTEAQNDPDNSPVVIWMNGGPGCSSLDGLFYELGPIHIYDNATLWDNAEYAWNKYANTLFLEAPVCVGFSYQDSSGDCSMTDNTTADDNYHAVLKFLDKFPVYNNSDFYITGESYGGVYVPTLTLRTLQGNANQDGENNPKVNLKGFAVGNGVTDSVDLGNSIQWYRYHHGMISEEVWNDMQQHCCTGNYDQNSCNFHNPQSTDCRNAISEADANCCGSINPYNLYGDCARSTLMHKELDESNQLYSWDKLLHEIRYNNINIGNIEGSPPCVDSKGGTTYLNTANVRNAIHVKDITWSICSNTLHYHSIWSSNMNPIYDNIFALDSDIYMTMYNGDTDTVCNFLGDEWFINNRNQTVTDAWREWYYTDPATGKQVGGWTKDFEKMHFVTVRGAGHMVPQYRPQAALKMFEYFLENKNLD